MRTLPLLFCCMSFIPVLVLGQTNEWSTQYVTFDDAVSGTGWNTPSVAVVGEDDFVALIARVQNSEDIFGGFNANYLVGYMDADSANGRVVDQPYGSLAQDQFEIWSSDLDQVILSGAWQIAGGSNNYVYVANNDVNHNILVFELTPLSVASTDFRMETGTTESIFAIDVDTSGYVYVVDYEGTDAKDNEVKVFAPIGASGTTWGDFGGHTDAPVATIDLPPGIYQGVAASGDGSQVFVSSINDKRILKFVGDPTSGYAEDASFSAVISPNDIYVDEDGIQVGSTTFLGLAYLDNPGILFAAVDSFLCISASIETCGGYNTGRIFVIDPADGTVADTIDVAQWNLDITGFVNTGSNNGRAGGFTSVYDVDTGEELGTVYSQTHYGWAIEKWVFDGELVVSVERIAVAIPQSFRLGQNYPNPFNPSTTIDFDLKQPGQVRLEVFNTLGQKVAILVNDRLAAGSYKAVFDATDFTSGVFFYKLTAANFTSVKKMVFTK